MEEWAALRADIITSHLWGVRAGRVETKAQDLMAAVVAMCAKSLVDVVTFLARVYPQGLVRIVSSRVRA